LELIKKVEDRLKLFLCKLQINSEIQFIIHVKKINKQQNIAKLLKSLSSKFIIPKEDV